MKKNCFWGIIFCLFVASDAYARFNFFSRRNNGINNLNWVEVSGKRFAPQVMLDFSHPLYFEKKINKEKMQLQLAFPGMNLKNFKDQKVISKLKTLKRLISKVDIMHKKVPSPRVVLTITFAKKDVLVRWNKMEDPNRLILDIFLKNSLKNLKNNGAIILNAKNNITSKGLPYNYINLDSPKLAKNIRIVVDAGHGGSDPGANGFFLLKEKDIALDIARRTKYMLKKNGFNAYLTRNNDKDLSLLERSELANQLKADLLVSIHVNAVKGVEKVNGMETYHLDSVGITSSSCLGSFLFVFNKYDAILAKKADKFLSDNIELSKNLASNIQKSVIRFLKNKKLEVCDRGTKKAKFRILLRSEIPVALIEVGFLTNKKEAKRLAMPAYRQMLAYGIGMGIKKYIYLQK